MGRKIFISYKHNDRSVASLGRYEATARAYVDYLISNTLDSEIYKGEGDEDLSEFKDSTIQTRLKDKIHDSSITIVLISPNMKETYEAENNQWIPWEISYSLKEITRNNRLSHSNGILAVVLPSVNQSYDYAFNWSNAIKKENLFQIIRDNSQYISFVKWQDFLSNKNHYLDEVTKKRDNRKSYSIVTEISNTPLF